MAVLAAAILAGCGSADSTPIRADATDASATPTAVAVAELEATGEPLEAGRYTRAGFSPTIILELDGSWEAVQLMEGLFDVQRDPGGADVVAVQFARPLGVFGADDAVEPTSAPDAVEILRLNPHLEVVESSSSRMSGLVGSQVTVENAGEDHAHVLEVPPGGLGIDPGRRLWIAFFDTSAGLLAIMVGGPTEGWDDALAAAEPILESVRIGED